MSCIKRNIILCCCFYALKTLKRKKIGKTTEKPREKPRDRERKITKYIKKSQ